MKRIIFFAAACFVFILSAAICSHGQTNHAPLVSNVYTQQRPGTRLFEISYDVDDLDGDMLTISVAVSDDGGSTFTVPASSFTGDVGSGIAPGTGKYIIWDAGADVPDMYGLNYRVKVAADDGYVDVSGMVLIPAGEFEMGDHFNEGSSDERPVHTVYVDAFYMDIYEVTNAQYGKLVQATGHREPEGYGYVNGNWQSGFKPWSDPNFSGDDQPVVCINLEDAKAYVDWAGKRLPTEAEWEKAARGGLSGKRYPWGNEISHDDANYYGTGGKDIWDGPSPVGSFAPNGYGLYDMAGNVYEWCADWYGSDYYSSSPKDNPAGPSSGIGRVLRGGSWSYKYGYSLRCAARYGNYPSLTYYYYGFRCSE